MANLLKTALGILASLLASRSGGLAQSSTSTSGRRAATADTGGTDCTLPHDLEIPSSVPYNNVPQAVNPGAVGGFSAQSADDQVLTVAAQASGCTLTVRPELGEINLRFGPALHFEPPIAKTRGGTQFNIVGVANPLNDDLNWFAVSLGSSKSGWIRSDLVTVEAACANLAYLDAESIRQSTPTQPAPTARFPLPTTASITQRYREPGHPGFDMGSQTGTVLRAPTDAVCIRRIVCTKCTEDKPNRNPNAQFQCPDLYGDIAWGYGYGNFMVLRFDYTLMPKPLRDEMDKRNLKGGFAYLLLAHLSRMDVQLGQSVRAGTVVGATGNTGCSTAPHLHFEVRIGKDTDVDNKWSKQTPVNPNLMFEV
ncbi:MAG: hypothetical protein OHK0046_15990 [Anaerolineae bacterium]